MSWQLHRDGRSASAGSIVLPEERLTWPRTIGFGMQHVVAMFGATFLVPTITGFPASTTLLFSGLGTMLFLLVTRNRLPSYLGSSFAFLAPIGAATAAAGQGAALAGVLITGACLTLVGVIVHFAGARWIDRLMPPIVAGAIVALIGFNLASAAKDNFEKAPVTATITLAAVILTGVIFRGLLGRLSIAVGVLVGYVAAVLRGEVDFSGVSEASWVGLPTFTHPEFSADHLGLYLMFLPVVLALIAENVGHVKGVGQLIGRDLTPMTGRTLAADGVSTMLAAGFGGSPTTTYGENIGVMAATRVFSTAAYWVAAVTAVLLGLSPKIGEVIGTIPAGVLGGVTTALYGLIGIIGVRMWVENKVDFGRPKNQLTAAVALIMGIANFTLGFGTLEFGGIILGTVAAILVYHVMDLGGRLFRTDVPEEPVAVAEPELDAAPGAAHALDDAAGIGPDAEPIARA